MKIVSVEPLFIDRYLFVKITTDNGCVGYGESGAWGHLEASEAALKRFAEYLVGQDPLRIEHHCQYMYRFAHFRGAAINGALSALDIALWDIAGKHFGVPVYQLLGGMTRDKARVYYHVFGETKEILVGGIKDAMAEGFTAVGHLTPFLDEERSVPYFKTHVDKMTDAIDTVGMYREAVGKNVDLCIEIHRRLTPAEAIVLGRGIEEYLPMFYEDPVMPENYDAMAEVARHVNVPIATGERYQTIHEFQQIIARAAVGYVRPDVCMVGGISGTKKVAALAEAAYIQVVPHNPLGPVSTAACLQVAACIPNFAIQEYPLGEREPPKSEIVKKPITLEAGFLLIPDAPGIGVELNEEMASKYPPKPRLVRTRLQKDGSVFDQ
ncbi:MAG: galactonate dehydratase [Dehalococcoidia bacterium]